MQRSDGMVVHKRMSFLASLVWGLSTIIVTLVVSLAVILIYGLNIADRKSDGLVSFAQQLISQAPQLAESLPPMIAEVWNDRRDPSYQSKLDVTIGFSSDQSEPSWLRPVVMVHNQGDQTVSLLTLRVTVIDGQGNLLLDQTEMAASPIGVDGDLRGPILPGSTRRFGSGYFKSGATDLKAEYEITDVRLWHPEAGGDGKKEEPKRAGMNVSANRAVVQRCGTFVGE